MYKFLTKNGQTVAFLLGVLLVGIFLASVFSGVGDWSPTSDNKYDTTIFDFGILVSRALVVICAILMVGFGLFHLATNFKGSIKGILGFVALAAVFLIAYSSASGEVTPFIQTAIDKFETANAPAKITENNLKFISGGIVTTGVLVGGAALAFILAEIRNLFK